MITFAASTEPLPAELSRPTYNSASTTGFSAFQDPNSYFFESDSEEDQNRASAAGQNPDQFGQKSRKRRSEDVDYTKDIDYEPG